MQPQSWSYEFYNLEQNKFEGCSIDSKEQAKTGVEGFVENMGWASDAPSGLTMSTDISAKNLWKNYTEMQTLPQDPNNNPSDPRNPLNPYGYDLSSNVVDPNGYGYVTPYLDEVRSKDSRDLLQQENATFVMGAVAGVSVIVLGILLASGVASPSDASTA